MTSKGKNMNSDSKELGFKRANRDIKVLLAELKEIVSAHDENSDPAKLDRNNKAFIDFFDQIVDQANTLKAPFLEKDTIQESNEHEEVAYLSRKILDLNKQLIDSEKAKSRFLSLIANELNNPMTVLLGMLPRLKPESNDKHKKIFAMVHQEVLMLNFRIQNLVVAAQIEGGDADTACASVDLEEIVKEVLEELKYLIEDKNISISFRNMVSQPVVSDTRKLYLILKNLIANGCAYGIADGIVEISLMEASSVLKITVSNQGYGPKVKFKPQVFTRFADGPEGKHGLGIGLSIVRELCESLEGSIDYFADNGWVTFSVILPLDSNELLLESFDGAIEL